MSLMLHLLQDQLRLISFCSPRSSKGLHGLTITDKSNLKFILYDNYAYNGMPVTVSAEGAPLPAFKGLVPAVTKNKVVKDTIDKVQRFEHETKCNVHDAELHTKTHDHLERSHAVDADSLFE